MLLLLALLFLFLLFSEFVFVVIYLYLKFDDEIAVDLSSLRFLTTAGKFQSCRWSLNVLCAGGGMFQFSCRFL